MNESRKPVEWLDPMDCSHLDKSIFPIGGFAPGGYINRCSSCLKFFTGMDKRAYQCLPCAITHIKNHLPEALEKAEKAEKELLKIKNSLATLKDFVNYKED